MKMLRFAALLGAAVFGAALGGCATTTTGTGTTTVTPLPNLNTYIAEAQQIAVNTCAFLPTAETVGSVITTLVSPSVAATDAIANQAASAICNAITASVQPPAPAPKSAKLRDVFGGPVTVNGVIIEGAFVTPATKGKLRLANGHRVK